MSQTIATLSDIDSRIVFHNADQIMEVSFVDLALTTTAEVNAFYDRIEERIAESGENWWFFLVDTLNSQVDNDVWFTYSRRGRVLRKAHSMGAVRFDPSEITRRQIQKDTGTEAFDPNLFADRDGAIARLRALTSKRRAKITHIPSFNRSELNWRIEFLPNEAIMVVDFSNMSFEHSRDVNDVYDFIERQVSGTGQKWYFLVNYENTRIQSAAWVQYAKRGKALNKGWSLGSVRYAPGSETDTDIRMRAESQGFRPNIRNSRSEALERIAEMKSEALLTTP